MGTGGPFPGAIAQPGCDTDHLPPKSAEVENEELYLLSTQVPLWHVVEQLKLMKNNLRNHVNVKTDHSSLCCNSKSTNAFTLANITNLLWCQLFEKNELITNLMTLICYRL
jgi:hypothetical protein